MNMLERTVQHDESGATFGDVYGQDRCKQPRVPENACAKTINKASIKRVGVNRL